MFNLNLQVGDKIMFVGNEERQSFTNNRVYEIIKTTKLNVFKEGNVDSIIVIDDAEEENCMTIPFFKNNFRRVSVTITIFDDDTFVTETDSAMLNWSNYNYTLELLLEMLDSLEIGYEIVSTSTELD